MRGTMAIPMSCLWAIGLSAHPHVLVDSGIEVMIDDRNRATGVRISWTCDDFYSLSVIGDMGWARTGTER